MAAGCVQRGAEGVNTGIAPDKAVVGRQAGRTIRAGEVHGAGVAGGHVAEGIQDSDRESEGHAVRDAGRGTDAQAGRPGRGDLDAGAAGDRGRRRVGGRDRLRAGRPEDHTAKSMHPFVRTREGIVVRQTGLPVRAGEVDGA